MACLTPLPTLQLCSTCKWWVPRDDMPERKVGGCVRHSPQAAITKVTEDGQAVVVTVFPTTGHDEFCGDWHNHPERVRARLQELVKQREDARAATAAQPMGQQVVGDTQLPDGVVPHCCGH